MQYQVGNPTKLYIFQHKSDGNVFIKQTVDSNRLSLLVYLNNDEVNILMSEPNLN